MRIVEYKQKPLDVTEKIIELRKDYRNVYMYQLDEQIYFYRPINRAEYKSLYENDRINDLDREDIIVSTCLLYPDNFDMDNCDAGLVTKLASLIIENSYISKDKRNRVINFYRADMEDIDNRIICIIHEAFPNIDIEEMEEWDMEKILKYLSRSEWILHHLRGIPIQQGNEAHEAFENKPEPELAKSPLRYNLPKKEEISEPESMPEEKPTHRGKKKTSLTPEKLAELKQKYPEIPWENDNGIDGVEGLEHVEPVGVDSPALRPVAELTRKKLTTQRKMDLLKNNET